MLANLPLSLAPVAAMLGAVLALGLALGVGLLTLRAGARIRTESEAATRLARDFALIALARAQDAPDPMVELDRLLAQGRTFRHLRVFIEAPRPPAAARRRLAHPTGSRRLATPRASVTRIEMSGG